MTCPKPPSKYEIFPCEDIGKLSHGGVDIQHNAGNNDSGTLANPAKISVLPSSQQSNTNATFGGLKRLLFERPLSIESSAVQPSGTTKAKPTKKVAFGTVTVREYARILLVDHPSCADGLGLGLGWEHSEDKILGIEVVEAKAQIQRARQRRLRRSAKSSSNCCRLNVHDRSFLLNDIGGYSLDELKSANKSRKQEQKNNKKQHRQRARLTRSPSPPHIA
eukprot:CAMPEP_0116853140 /NCGR_PEP_ID=MMETSP0418-20121206/17729_1 /TAXON_ID=1158023 /ORGANISM="Astrosyne radiata, Strain 13vi08-1A" /LENGTH=219 /DNA_ID=CAMNT_0004485473 /DNA_START=268 /DNA_END=927 /DNA_ORIENTATION=+